jgi:hypothetical protein
MKYSNLIALALISATAALAQSWSQPVREVEKEARSAVRGACSGSILANSNVGSGAACSITLPDQQSVQAVPAGKHLVVEDISASCETVSGEIIARLSLGVFPPAPAVAWHKWIPLASQGTTGSIAPRTWRAASMPARFYAPPGSTLGLNLFSGTPVTAYSSCDVRFAGHLVNAQ